MCQVSLSSDPIILFLILTFCIMNWETNTHAFNVFLCLKKKQKSNKNHPLFKFHMFLGKTVFSFLQKAEFKAWQLNWTSKAVMLFKIFYFCANLSIWTIMKISELWFPLFTSIPPSSSSFFSLVKHYLI